MTSKLLQLQPCQPKKEAPKTPKGRVEGKGSKGAPAKAPAASARKLKILCLHGYRQSGKAAREKLGSFRKAVTRHNWKRESGNELSTFSGREAGRARLCHSTPQHSRGRGSVWVVVQQGFVQLWIVPGSNIFAQEDKSFDAHDYVECELGFQERYIQRDLF